MERVYQKEITFLSNYSWDNPNVLELLCETASYKEKNIRYFSKPQSIFKNFFKCKIKSYIKSIDCKPLFNLSIKFCKIPYISILQNKFIWKQIYKKEKENVVRILIYNNLDSLSNLNKLLINHFDLLIYLCEDYSDLNKRLTFNCDLADSIFVIPKSMVEVIQNKFFNKKIIHWPQPVTNISLNDLSIQDKIIVDETLSKIPEPRIIYSGHGLDRLDKNIFLKISQSYPNYSFIYFGEKSTITADNIFQLPSFTKHQMKYIISKSQLGFMPYDVTNPHNYHCVPLKLFDYFSAGLPVVSSYLINVQHYDHLVYMCKSFDEFNAALKKGLDESKYSKKRIQRKEIYNYHSSFSRCEDFDKTLSQLISNKLSTL